MNVTVLIKPATFLRVLSINGKVLFFLSEMYLKRFSLVRRTGQYSIHVFWIILYNPKLPCNQCYACKRLIQIINRIANRFSANASSIIRNGAFRYQIYFSFLLEWSQGLFDVLSDILPRPSTIKDFWQIYPIGEEKLTQQPNHIFS